MLLSLVFFPCNEIRHKKKLHEKVHILVICVQPHFQNVFHVEACSDVSQAVDDRVNHVK